MTQRSLRLGVDVGGTFTDVVAIDAATRELVARTKVPTTHTSPQGVAEGIVTGVTQLLAQTGVRHDDVAFIAHSTTQATNALLEGDVASVGIVGLLNGAAWPARPQMRIAPIELAPGTSFAPQTVYARARDERSVRGAVDALKSAGATAIVSSQAFGVDDTTLEESVVSYARELGLHATSGHDVATTYGLRARTRTAALNAAILPTMVRTARMTAEAVERAGIASPLMIMRSDGGVMDVREVERRPILTMLSGPAAGVAGALLYENVTDGIFIEIGGTSSDCSAIRAGMPQMRSAQIGGRRALLRTVDVRTLGIAGGSMPRIGTHGIVDVGPRSAHIAGCSYASFVDPRALDGASVEFISPAQRDPHDYAVLVAPGGTRITVTPTCASNLLGYVPENAFARGNVDAARRAFHLLGAQVGMSAEQLATQLLDCAAKKLSVAIDELVADYGLDPSTLLLVGGGGGAASLVPYVAKQKSLAHTLARDAEVISPIGVALALVRDVVERTIVNPTAEDIVRVRREAADRVVAAGAAADRVEVAVEIDTQRNRVRATASGATALVEAAGHGVQSDERRRAAAGKSLQCEASDLQLVAQTTSLSVYQRPRTVRERWRRTSVVHDQRIVDDRGVVRLGLRGARILTTKVVMVADDARSAIENATSFGDVGRALPSVYVLHGARIADFIGLASVDQVVALIEEDLAGRAPDEAVVILTVAAN